MSHGIDPKGDAGAKKAPLHFLPSTPLHEVSWVLKHGADKYGPYNWRGAKVKASTYRSAMGRHLDQWFDGLEDADPETGLSHLAHVISSALIVLDAMKHGTLADDRPAGSAVSEHEAHRKAHMEVLEEALSEKAEEVRARVKAAIGDKPPYQVATLPSGHEVLVPELPEGYDDFKVLPKNTPPGRDDLAVWWREEGVIGSLEWETRPHYAMVGARTHFQWIVATKSPKLEIDPSWPELPEPPAGKRGWERVPQEEADRNNLQDVSSLIWYRARNKQWYTNDHYGASSRTYGGKVVYLRPVPISNC